MPGIYIAFGANLSNPKRTFREALRQLNGRGAQVQAVSGLWSSPSWPAGQGHPDYLNGAAKLSFEGSAHRLLSVLAEIEKQAGRVRREKNAPRPLDLDIIDFNGISLNSDDLALPHPRATQRGFVMLPLQQIAPNWQDPVSGLYIDDLIARLPLCQIAPMAYEGRLES